MNVRERKGVCLHNRRCCDFIVVVNDVVGHGVIVGAGIFRDGKM